MMPSPPDDNRGLAQNCYTTAYRVLPRYAFEDPGKLLGEFGRDADYAARLFYVMGCRLENAEPRAEDVRAVTGHSGSLDGRFDYHVVQYPPAPPVNLMHLAHLGDVDLMEAMRGFVLAPYFSAVVYAKLAGTVAHYFVLGQSPEGWTTLREITPEMNANLGPGCEPDLAAFLALLADRLRPSSTPSPPVAGVRLPRRGPRRKRWWQFWN